MAAELDRGLDHLAADERLDVGAELSAAEVRYLMRYEWAVTPEDVLWRRSKLGLTISRDDQSALARFMADAAEQKSAAQ